MIAGGQGGQAPICQRCQIRHAFFLAHGHNHLNRPTIIISKDDVLKDALEHVSKHQPVALGTLPRMGGMKGNKPVSLPRVVNPNFERREREKEERAKAEEKRLEDLEKKREQARREQAQEREIRRNKLKVELPLFSIHSTVSQKAAWPELYH